MRNRSSAIKIILLTSVGAAALLINGCSKNSDADADAPAEFKVNVVGFKTIQKDMAESVSLIGTLQADESVEIRSEISGKVAKINFKEGESVKEGDILIEIDPGKLKATLSQAEANLKLAETTAQRYQTLVDSKAVSRQEYEETVATLESSKAAVELAREQLKDATITAPFDGVMGERLISTGQFITQGAQLSFLYSQDPIKAEIHVPERYLGDVKVGQTLNLKVAAFKDKIYEGEVYFIDPKIDETTRTALVKAYADNPTGELKEGMFANISLIVNVKKDALVVPETALIIKGDDVSVFVVDGSSAANPVTVKTGKRVDGMVIIEEGLNKGDVVVLEGYQKLGPGSKVEVRFEDISKKELHEII